MWQATHFQTKEKRTGSWSDLCDLDKRQWKLKRVTLKSHSPTVENLITKVYTVTFCPAQGRVREGLFPVTNTNQ